MSLLRPLLVVLALALPFAPPAHAGAGELREVARELGLSADQLTKVTQIVYQSKSARITAKAALERARLDLRHALAAEPMDEKAIRKAVADLNTATAGLVENRVNEVIELRRVLTPDQYGRLAEIWGDRREEAEDEDDDE